MIFCLVFTVSAKWRLELRAKIGQYRNRCVDKIWSLMYKREIVASLREVFLCIVLTTFAWHPGVLLTNNSYLRVAYVCSVSDTRCLHEGFTSAPRSRFAFLTQLFKHACPSCCPRVWFGRHRVVFRSNRNSFWCIFFCDHLRELLRAKLETLYSCVHRGLKSGQCDASIEKASRKRQRGDGIIYTTALIGWHGIVFWSSKRTHPF